jgi:predicted nucleic acid-binding protein
VARVVLIDASPLIGLAIVDGLSWLPELFGTVWMPPEVHDEVLRGPVTRGQASVRSALAGSGLRVWEGERAQVDLPDLDEGEAACLRIALAVPPGQALVLMDEKAGRRVAADQGVAVAGTATVIGQARFRGLVPSARAVFERLHASDFRISADVIRTVLARAGEA